MKITYYAFRKLQLNKINCQTKNVKKTMNKIIIIEKKQMI